MNLWISTIFFLKCTPKYFVQCLSTNFRRLRICWLFSIVRNYYYYYLSILVTIAKLWIITVETCALDCDSFAGVFSVPPSKYQFHAWAKSLVITSSYLQPEEWSTVILFTYRKFECPICSSSIFSYLRFSLEVYKCTNSN